jgi:peroxiredoxin Q/BCP
MIVPGNKIDTNFELDIVQNGEEKRVSFGELLYRPTIVSVYMKNNTGSCDKQNASLVDAASKLDDLGYNVVALSKDKCGSHKRYAEKLGISYILASDPDNTFSRKTDSIVEKKMYGKTYEGPSRSAFLIDTDGTVKAVIEKVNSKEHGPELIELIGTLG